LRVRPAGFCHSIQFSRFGHSGVKRYPSRFPLSTPPIEPFASHAAPVPKRSASASSEAPTRTRRVTSRVTSGVLWADLAADARFQDCAPTCWIGRAVKRLKENTTAPGARQHLIRSIPARGSYPGVRAGETAVGPTRRDERRDHARRLPAVVALAAVALARRLPRGERTAACRPARPCPPRRPRPDRTSRARPAIRRS
jgi:hypothetical protein